MSAVQGLGYIGVRARDLEGWTTFGRDLLGMDAQLDQDVDSAVRFKIDGRRWRLEVTRAADDGLAYLGWEVPGPQELRRLVERLESAGVKVEVAGPDLTSARSVQELVLFDDPAGTHLEAFCGAADDCSFRSPTGVSGFVTGTLGMGHAVLVVSSFADCLEFYTEVLGFKVRETARIGPAQLVFLGSCQRHHSLGLADSGVASGAPTVLQHIMVEVAEVDDVGRAHDRCLDAGVDFAMTLGRHTNDHMLSFYAKSPSGFDVEYGCGGLVVGDDFPATTMVRADFWGHRFPGTNMSLNDMLSQS